MMSQFRVGTTKGTGIKMVGPNTRGYRKVNPNKTKNMRKWKWITFGLFVWSCEIISPRKSMKIQQYKLFSNNWLNLYFCSLIDFRTVILFIHFFWKYLKSRCHGVWYLEKSPLPFSINYRNETLPQLERFLGSFPRFFSWFFEDFWDFWDFFFEIFRIFEFFFEILEIFSQTF